MSEQENKLLNIEFTEKIENINFNKLPGAQLAQQRKIKGWSVEYVASQLKLAIRQVLALEADNYSMLPSLVIARGFIRSYAKLLKLDSSILVKSLPLEEALFEKKIVSRKMIATPFCETPLPLSKRNKFSFSLIVSVIFIIFLISIVLLVYNTDLFDKISQLTWLKKTVK